MSEEELQAEIHALGEEHARQLVEIANLRSKVEKLKEVNKNLLIKVRELIAAIPVKSEN